MTQQHEYHGPDPDGLFLDSVPHHHGHKKSNLGTRGSEGLYLVEYSPHTLGVRWTSTRKPTRREASSSGTGSRR